MIKTIFVEIYNFDTDIYCHVRHKNKELLRTVCGLVDDDEILEFHMLKIRPTSPRFQHLSVCQALIKFAGTPKDNLHVALSRQVRYIEDDFPVSRIEVLFKKMELDNITEYPIQQRLIDSWSLAHIDLPNVMLLEEFFYKKCKPIKH